MRRRIDLRTPDVKLPAFVSDVMHDLGDRRLLPLVALVILALIAVPFLLSHSASPPAAPAPGAGARDAAKTSELTVVQTDHGLRVPGKRLSHLSPKDPFEQQYTGPAGGNPAVSETSTSETVTSDTSTTVTSSSSTEGEAGGSGGSGEPAASSPPRHSGGGSSGITVFTFAIDLKIVKVSSGANGSGKKKSSETRHRVLPATTLPAKKVQVATYLGISPDTKRPLFMVSDEVSSILGEAECVAGTGSCQLVEAEKGYPLTFVYGPNDVRFKFVVLNIEPVTTGHL